MPKSKDTLAEILKWSADRPAWQRDALRRVFVSGVITEDDLAELTNLCKLEHGLGEGEAMPVPLAVDHLPIKGTSADAVILVSLTHHHGANALAPEQTVTFGSGLTVVFGENATGKSGYTRILKRACRSRAREDLLGNVLDTTPPLALNASIRFRQGEADQEWTSGDSPSGALAFVSIFDSHCAPVYLRDKTDVAFRPFGLDVFDSLAVLCGQLKGRLQKDQTAISSPKQGLPVLSEGTKARKLVDGLKAFTNPSDVTILATLATEERDKLKELRQQRSDLQAANPSKLAKDLQLKASRIESVATHLARLSDSLGTGAVAKLERMEEAVRVAQGALGVLQKATLTKDLLPGTGEKQWRDMWMAVNAYAKVVYPRSEPFLLKEGDLCPFCQQVISHAAADRLRHFAEYIASTAQADLRKAESERNDAVRTLAELAVRPASLDAAFAETAGDDEELATRIETFLVDAEAAKKALGKAATDGEGWSAIVLQPDMSGQILGLAKKLRDRADVLETKKAEMSPSAFAELRELEARAALGEKHDVVLAEIERKKKVKQYDDCISDTSTTAITKKSTELTARLVTEQLRNSFRDELKQLEFKHLLVELKAAGGAKGALYHQLVFANAPGVEVSRVLSEGESRTLSLAAFLAELSTAETKSGIVFDDPVSSLDHAWRERIARRLTSEAKQRQVIVFTHDILFLQNLLDQAQSQAVACHFQQICRGGQVGIASSELPWIAMPVKERIGKLKVLAQAAKKTFSTAGKEAYQVEAERIYGMLRESWEHAITEVLLNDVVERYRHSIETKKLRVLNDISEKDYKAIDEGMSECSRWMRGHDKPAADGTPYPEPDEVIERIGELETWAKEVRKRREKK